MLAVHISLLQKIYFSHKTSEGSENLIGYCSICNKKKSMTVSDNTKQTVGLGHLFKNLGYNRFNVSKNRKKRFEQSNTSLRYYSKHCYRSGKQEPQKEYYQHYLL